MGFTSQILEEGIQEGLQGLRYQPFNKLSGDLVAYNESYYDGFYYGRMKKRAFELGVEPYVVIMLCTEPRWKIIPDVHPEVSDDLGDIGGFTIT